MKKVRVVGWSVTHVELLISRVNREQGIISLPYANPWLLWTLSVFLFDSFLLYRVHRVKLITCHFIFCSPLFFCLLCNVSVKSPQTKTHLEVFVEVKSLPRATVKVTVSTLSSLFRPRRWSNFHLFLINSIIQFNLRCPFYSYLIWQNLGYYIKV